LLIEEKATNGGSGRCIENNAALMKESFAAENGGKQNGHVTDHEKPKIEDPAGRKLDHNTAP
jgi:hypothetical protein